MLKLFSDLAAENPPTGANTSILQVNRFTPYKVALRDLDLPFDDPNLAKRLNLGGKCVVDAEDLAVHHRSNFKVVKYVCTVLSGFDLPYFLCIVVEAVHLCDLTT